MERLNLCYGSLLLLALLAMLALPTSVALAQKIDAEPGSPALAAPPAESGPDADQLIKDAALRHTVALQMAQLEIEDAYRRGVAAYTQGEFEKAISELERARDTLNWLQPQVEVANYPKLITDYLAKSRTGLKQSQEIEARHRQQQADQIARTDAQLRLDAERQRIDSLYAQAKEQYNAGNYEAARSLGEAVLGLEPDHRGAAGVIDASSRQTEIDSSQRLAQVKGDQQLTLTQQLDAMTTPQTDLVVYPPNWEEIKQRKVDTSITFGEEEDAEWRQKIEAALKQKISFEFADTSVDEALRFLHAVTGVSFVLDQMAVEGKSNLRVSLAMSDVSLDSALKYITSLLGLAYTLKDEAVFITTPDRAEGEPILKLYNVSDLIYGVNDFHMGTDAIMKADDQGDHVAWPPGDRDKENEVFTGEGLANFIRTTISPDSWTGEKTVEWR